MRLHVRHLCLAVVIMALVSYLAIRDEADQRYCTSCGLLRLSHYRACFGYVVPISIQYRETEFHRLLFAAGRVDCSHQWQGYFENHHNVLHRGDVHIPIILTSYGCENLVALVAKVNDPDKRFAILNSFDLTEILSIENDVTAALEDLTHVPGEVSEQAWWTKHQRPFVARRPRSPVLKRTRPTR